MSATSRSLTEGGTDRNIDTREESGVSGELFSGCINIQQPLNSSPLTANRESENREKGRKRRGISEFIQRSWKSVKLPFLRRHRTRVGPAVPPVQPDTQTSYPEQTPVPFASIPEEHHTKGKKLRGVSGFLQTTWKSVKRPFLHFHKNKVGPVVPPVQPDPHTPDLQQTPVAFVSRPQHRPGRERRIVSKLSSLTDSSWLEQTSDSDSADSDSFPDTDSFESVRAPDRDLAFPEPQSVLDASSLEPTDGEVVSHYTFERLLGSGSFGLVFQGTRKSDGEKVAIKLLSKSEDDRYLVIPGHSKPLLTEVALMLMMRGSPISPFVIQMFEWYEDPSRRELSIIMEYPYPCVSLHSFIQLHDELSETTACIIMCRAVQAVQHCINHGVFYTDLHTENFLVNPCTLHLKLIDFSCGQLFSSAGYDRHQYVGASDYCPPEVLKRPTFHAVPANVWSLGLIMFELVNGCLPYAKSEEVLFVNPDLSRACRDAIRQCLNRNPDKRPTLQQFLRHKWFKQLI